MIPKYFHYISQSQYLFYTLGAYLIFTESILRTENSLSGIGFGVFLIGVGFAVGSLSDIEKISKKEKKLFANPEKFRKQTRSHFVLSCIILLVSLLFISIKFINRSLDPEIAEQYTNLGYGCIAFSLGIFLELKQMFEKRIIFNQQNEIESPPNR